MSETVQIIEVGPRDGLQNEKRLISTDDKLALIDQLIDAGVRRIEAVSFVNPRMVPNMADADEVMRGVPRHPGVSYIGLALNTRGVERAIAAGVDEINFVLPATDAFAHANQNTTVEVLLSSLAQSAPLAAAARIPLSVTIAVAFGCPYQGAVPTDQVLGVAQRALDAGHLAELALADTIGCGVPWQSSALFAAAGEITEVPLRAHFHETRHTALANTYAAMAVGVRRFDSSVGGLGGCPFAPGAAGNISTEDLAWMLTGAGFEHGVDLEKVIAAGRAICDLVGVLPRSGLAQAGVFPPAR